MQKGVIIVKVARGKQIYDTHKVHHTVNIHTHMHL